MAPVVADTHAIIWFLQKDARLSEIARTAFREAEHATEAIYVSPVTVVETIYLVERGRIEPAALTRLTYALADPATVVTQYPLDLGVALTLQRIPRDVVPEMPDRIIAATALHLGLPLVTRDSRIQACGIPTIW
jgi:PIN domain nuclease of toxin-antitoxin system